MYVTPEPRGGLKSFLGQTEALGHALMGKISPKVCAAYFTKIVTKITPNPLKMWKKCTFSNIKLYVKPEPRGG